MLVKQFIAVDYSNVFMRGFYGSRRTTEEGVPIGGVEAVLKSVSSHMIKYRTSKIVVCMDTPPYDRKKKYSNYKSDRKPMEPELLANLQDSKKIGDVMLKMLGIPVWSVAGMEGDDLLAAYAKKHRKKPHKRVILVATDDDLYQCLHPRVLLSTKNGTFTLSSFKALHPELDPHDWPLRTAFVGSHNGVPGVKGIGPVGAKKLFLDEVLLQKAYAIHKKDVDMYQDLAVLPFTKIKVPAFVWGTGYNERKFTTWCDSLGVYVDNQILSAFRGV